MQGKHLGLVLLVIAVWGFNFVMIQFGLRGVSPFLLGALRFVLAAFPAVFFVPRPKVRMRDFFMYALPMSFGQFAFLFTAMKYGMPAGLASVVTQIQAVFTVTLAALFFAEPIRKLTMLGFAIAAYGLYTIASVQGTHGTMLGFLLSIAAAFSWALGNIATKKLVKDYGPKQLDMFGLVVWTSLIPPLPFLALSYFMEGPEEITQSFHHITSMTIVSIIYISGLSTLFGYGVWTKLLSRYHAGLVAPFTLLVPIFGLTSTHLFLGEKLVALQWLGILLVMIGLTFHALGPRIVARLQVQRSL